MRTLIYIILDILEPFIRIPCLLLSRIGVIFSLFLEFVWKAPNFPLLRMLGFFLLLGLLQRWYLDVLYYFKDTRQRLL